MVGNLEEVSTPKFSDGSSKASLNTFGGAIRGGSDRKIHRIILSYQKGLAR